MRKLALRTALLAAPLLAAWLWCSAASAAVINATFDSNYTADRQACAQAAIDQWENTLLNSYTFDHVRMLIMDLSFLGTPLAATNINFGAYYPQLAEGDASSGGQWQMIGPGLIPWDSNTYITIALNTNYVDSTYFGLSDPVPAGKYDALTIFRHELGHAVGFAEEYADFADNLTDGPGSNRTYNGDSFTVEITPASQGTHVVGYANDLMNAGLPAGVRRDISADPDLMILMDAYGYTTPEPATITLLVAGLAGVVAVRRRRAA